MKMIALTVVMSTLLPMAAMAAEATPRDHCLQKIARKESVVLNAVARSRGASSQTTLRIPAYYLSTGMGFRSGNIGFDLGSSMGTLVVPSERAVMATELRVLEWHRGECARLPDSGKLALHTKVARGGGTRKLKIVQP